MNRILWLVGEPGVGKTTLARQLIEPKSMMIVKPKWTVGTRVVAAGHYTGAKFDGADTVPYNGVAAALAFWADSLRARAQLTVLDGDRFSNGPTVEFFRALGSRLFCVHLVAPELAAQRREQRGGGQNKFWVKGRATKSQNFFKLVGGLELSADASPEHLTKKVLAEPFFSAAE